MSPRAVIAAQGVAVAVLVLVVYVTLLREDSGTPLPDIQAPGSEQQAQGPGGGGGGGRPSKDGKPGQGSSNGGGGGGDDDGGPRGPIGVGASLAGAPATGVGGAGPVLRGPTPRADQYADAVSDLLSKIHSAPGASPLTDR